MCASVRIYLVVKSLSWSLQSSSVNRSAAKTYGLEVWMDRVLDRAEQVEKSWDADDVHDLRVALRRCRTMADALSEVTPDSAWRKIKKGEPRPLPRAPAHLRDIQVQRIWIKD